jgi:hypothetical protein
MDADRKKKKVSPPYHYEIDLRVEQYEVKDGERGR